MQTSTKNNIRKAGSSEFTNGLTKAKDPFTINAEKVNNQQKAYDAAEARGYDDLNNYETYQAQKQYNNLKEGGRFEYQGAARAGLKDSGFDFGGDLSSYNSEAAGTKKFDMGDVNYLKKSGASDEAINKYISGLDNVHDNVSLNKDYGGKHYRGDIDKSKGIEQFDMGKGFNKWDIQYLQNQGFDDKAITDYGLASGLNHGSGTAKYLDKQGRLDTRAKNTFNNQMGPGSETNTDTSTPNLGDQQKRVDEEVNRDNFSKQTQKEIDYINQSPNEHDSQKFLSKHIGMARDLAASRTGLDLSEYSSGINVNVQELDKHIRKTPLYWGARSELQGLKTFGDMYRNSREDALNWTGTTPMEGIETPDFMSIYKDTKKDIDGIDI